FVANRNPNMALILLSCGCWFLLYPHQRDLRSGGANFFFPSARMLFSKAIPHCTPGGAVSRLSSAAHHQPIGAAWVGTPVPVPPCPPGRNTMRPRERPSAPPRNHP